MSLNQCQFIGHLGADPETRKVNESTVTSFKIACTDKYIDKAGNKQEKTEWVNCQCWGKLAEIIAQYGKKGQQVYISGKMSTRDYEKDGVKRYITEIIVSDFQMLGKKESGVTAAPESNNKPEGDDLPF